MRIDKLLANLGYGSRKDVKQLLKKGLVKADGAKLSSASSHVDPEAQEITVSGETVDYKPYIYLMMHKPQQVISATVDDVHDTVIDILEIEDAVRDPFPVGRLDKDTEGLLLITNDGKFAHALTSPKKGVKKTYEAVLDQDVSEEDTALFKSGVTLDAGYVTKPAELYVKDGIDKKEVIVVISEGKFHQVKRMFEAVGKKVLYLKRTHIGTLALDPDLAPGEYREMSSDEVEDLLEEAYQKKSNGSL
ncbi:pseudouridine synthase [Alteribacillus sp. HJP-4]|uniref:pseudouridine synthase n=1 Tax=Alteribacillus sp. HJP-4 TaxID=2775394 RepID=UPI0035CCD43C